MATYITDKIEFNNNIYKLQDSDALPLAGGNVTGPVNFGDTVTIEQASVGDLIITGNASSTNNLQVNTINGVAVGNSPKFTDTGWIPFGQVDSTSTSTAFTATIDGITELKPGTCVLLKNGVVTSESGFTININNLGAKPVYNNLNNTRDTTIFNKDYTMLFVYNPTEVSGGAWICYRGYDSNTNTIGYQLRTNNTVLKTYDKSRYYRIFFTSADGTHWVPANTGTDNSSTSKKTVNQRPINPFGRIVYTSASTSYAAGADIAATTIWDQYNMNLGYSFNTTGATLTLTSKNPVYIKCAPQSDGSVVIDSTTPFVQTLPTSEDGKIYIFLGIATSATNVELIINHPVYMYKNGKIIQYTGSETDDLSQIGGRNLLIGTEKKLFQGVSNTLEIPYQLSLYAQSKNVFYIQDETYTISFDYTVSNAGGTVAIKVNNLDGVPLDIGNRYDSSLSQSVTAVKTTYRRTVKISQAQANNAGNASFKIVFSGLTSNSTVTVQNVKLEYGNIVTDYTPSPEELGWEPQLVAPEGEKVQYIGEEVSFNTLEKPNVYIQEFKRAAGTSGASDENSWQGMDVYGKYLFRAKTNGTVYVYDLTERYQNLSIIDSFQLGSYRTAAGTRWGLTFDTSNHAGVLCFTDKKFNNSDEFPLLLVSDGSGSDTSEIDGKGYCYIQRIQRTGNEFTSTTVGVIYLHWARGSQAHYDNDDFTTYFCFPWVQWHYYDGYIYSFGHKRRASGGTTKVFNEHVLTRWKSDISTLINVNATDSSNPKITTFNQTSSSSNGTATSNWIDNQWRIEFTQNFMQGCRFYNDKIIATFGHGTAVRPNKIVIFSLVSTTAIAIIDLTKTPAVATKTMEGCLIYNNKILLGFTGDESNDAASMLYSLSFVKNKTGEVAEPLSLATTSTDGLMSAADKTMLDTMSASYVLNPNLQPPITAVDPLFSVFRTIGVLGDSYASGSFYENGDNNTYIGHSNVYEMSWGKMLGRMYGGYYGGKNVMNYSFGGATAKTWLNNGMAGRGWNKFDSDLQTTNGKAKDLYIIAFGINDYLSITNPNSSSYDSTYSWGSEADITNFTNTTNSSASNYYLSSPQTFLGIYNRIIRHIKKLSPDSIIVILSYLRTDFDSNGIINLVPKNTVNQYLDKVVKKLGSNIVYIDVESDPYFSSNFYTRQARINNHPTAVGYAGMASAITRLIGKAIRENPTKFVTVGKLPDPTYLTTTT